MNAPVTIRGIQKAVAEEFGCTVPGLVGPCRSAEIALPRHVAMYLARTMLRCSMPKIGHYFRDRDSATVRYGVDRIARMMDEAPSFAEQVAALRARIERGPDAQSAHETAERGALHAIEESLAVLKDRLIAAARRDPLAVLASLSALAEAAE